jgi:hypothetical protein
MGLTMQLGTLMDKINSVDVSKAGQVDALMKEWQTINGEVSKLSMQIMNIPAAQKTTEEFQTLNQALQDAMYKSQAIGTSMMGLQQAQAGAYMQTLPTYAYPTAGAEGTGTTIGSINVDVTTGAISNDVDINDLATKVSSIVADEIRRESTVKV